jgi:hypothetical protein
MGITCSCKTKVKAAPKLYNQIITYIFEQEYGELEGNSKAQKALAEVKKALAEMISKNSKK